MGKEKGSILQLLGAHALELGFYPPSPAKQAEPFPDHRECTQQAGGAQAISHHSPWVHIPHPTSHIPVHGCTSHIPHHGHTTGPLLDLLWEEDQGTWFQDILQCPCPPVTHFPVCSAPAMVDAEDRARSLKTLLFLFCPLSL